MNIDDRPVLPSLSSQHSLNVVVKPILPQNIPIHVVCATDRALASFAPTGTIKRLRHIPFRARVPEREVVAFLDVLVADTYFEFGHIEDETRRAGVVAEDQFGVELDVAVLGGLNRRVCFYGRRGSRYTSKEGMGWEVDQRHGAGTKGLL